MAMKFDKPITKFCSAADEIIAAVENAAEGDVIGVNAGTYEFIGMHRVTFKNKRDVTLRSVSGRADDVIFRGDCFHKTVGYYNIRGDLRDIPVDINSDNCGIGIHGITFRDSNCFGVRVHGKANNGHITIDGCKFINICERMIKGTKDGKDETNVMVPDVTITNNYFEDNIIPVKSDHMDEFEGDYISAIDMMVLDGAVISGNVFRNIKGLNGGGRGAIFIWVGSKNVVAERNVIVNCDRGICFGNPGGTGDGEKDNEFPRWVDGGAIRNNIVVNNVSFGIEIANTNNITVSGNIVLRKNDGDEFKRAIGETTISDKKRSAGLKIVNNIVYGAISAKGAEISGNIEGEAAAAYWAAQNIN